MEGFVGEIRMFAGSFEPENWLFCDGRVLKVDEYDLLHHVITNDYGGDGHSTFALPDLRGRTPRGVHHTEALKDEPVEKIQLGEAQGHGRMCLQAENIPKHEHSCRQVEQKLLDIRFELKVAMNGEAVDKVTEGSYIGGKDNKVKTLFSSKKVKIFREAPTSTEELLNVVEEPDNFINVSASGQSQSQPFPIVDPYIGMNYIICIDGVFPSRA